MHNGNSTSVDPAKTSEEAEEIDQPGQAKSADQTEESGSISADSHSQTVKRRRRSIKRTAFSDSDSDSESDLSRDDLIKLVAEKEELLKLKKKEIEKMQDKVLRTYAEMENVMDRTRREAEFSFCSYVVVTSCNPWPTVTPPVRHSTYDLLFHT